VAGKHLSDNRIYQTHQFEKGTTRGVIFSATLHQIFRDKLRRNGRGAAGTLAKNCRGCKIAPKKQCKLPIKITDCMVRFAFRQHLRQGCNNALGVLNSVPLDQMEMWATRWRRESYPSWGQRGWWRVSRSGSASADRALSGGLSIT
jgi:hypothetical protein